MMRIVSLIFRILGLLFHVIGIALSIFLLCIFDPGFNSMWGVAWASLVLHIALAIPTLFAKEDN